MGRIKLNTKGSKQAETPAAILAITDNVLKARTENIGDVLEGFKWEYDKGDFLHWVPLINFFDEYLETHATSRNDVRLLAGEKDACPFPTKNVTAILRATQIILEHCHNGRSYYNSMEHLSALLAAPDMQVVKSVLHCVSNLMRRRSQWGQPSKPLDTALASRLFCMAQLWTAREAGVGLVAAATDGPIGAAAERSLTTLRLEVKSSDGRPQRTISVPGLGYVTDPDHDVMAQLSSKYGVPEESRFDLLTRIRGCKLSSNPPGRRLMVSLRLEAFYGLVLAMNSIGFASQLPVEISLKLYMAEPELVQELLGLLQAEDKVPLNIRTLALRVLIGQMYDKQRSPGIAEALIAGGQSSILALLLRKAVAALSIQPRPAAPQYDTVFVEVLLHLMSLHLASPTATDGLVRSGAVSVLLPVLALSEPEYAPLVVQTVKLLESMLDHSNAAHQMFQELGGFAHLVRRLAMETESEEASAARSEAGGAIDAASSSATAPAATLSYPRRGLLRSLFRGVVMINMPNAGTGPNLSESELISLYTSVNRVFSHSSYYTSEVFVAACSVVTDFIHHEPLRFRLMDRRGVTKTFLEAIERGVVMSSDSLNALPSVLYALCLNSGGLERVKRFKPLKFLVRAMTDKVCLRHMQATSFSYGFGQALDELLRHNAPLVDHGVDCTIGMLRRICFLSGDAEGSMTGAEPAAPAAAAPTAGASGEPGPAGRRPSDDGAMEVEEAGARADAPGAAGPSGTPAPGPAGSVPMDTDTPAGAGAGPGANPPAEQAAGEAGQGAGPSDEADTAESEAPDPSAPEFDLDRPGVTVSEVEAPFDASLVDHIPEAIAGTTKLLEVLLNQKEFCTRFVRKGGLELLLRAFSLSAAQPAPSASLGYTTTGALLGVVKSVGVCQPDDPVAKALLAAMGRQLAATHAFTSALPANQNPAELKGEDLRAYTRHVVACDGLTIAAGALVRNSPALLLDVCAKAAPGVEGCNDSLVTLLSRTVTVLIGHAAVGEEWREAKALADRKEQQDKDKAGVPRDATPAGDAAPSNSDGADGGTMDVDGPAEGAARDGAGAGPSGAAAVTLSGRRRRQGEEVAAEHVATFVAAARSHFLQAIAKSSHSGLRRGTDPSYDPPFGTRAASLALASALRYLLDTQQPSLRVGEISAAGLRAMGPAALKLVSCQLTGYVRAAEALSAVLVDTKRSFCHALVLNYFVGHCGGLDALLKGLQHVVTILQAVVPWRRELQEEVGKEVAARVKAGSYEVPELPELNRAVSRVEARATQCFEVALRLTTRLCDPVIMLTSSNMTLLTHGAPLPGLLQQSTPHDKFYRGMVATIYSRLAEFWSGGVLAVLSPRACTDLLTALWTSHLLRTAPLPEPQANPTQAPGARDNENIQTLVEMGFSVPDSTAALARYAGDVMLALESLVARGGRAAHSGQPAAPAAAASGAAADPALLESLRSVLGEAATPAQPAAAATAPSDGAGPSSAAAPPSEEDTMASDDAGPSGAATAVAAGPTAAGCDIPMLSLAEAVSRSVQVVRTAPATAFALVDVLTALLLKPKDRFTHRSGPPPANDGFCSRYDPERGRELASLLMGSLEASTPGDRLGPAHLLVVLVSGSNNVDLMRRLAANGFADWACRALDAWTRDAPAGEQIPRWVDAILLVLDSMSVTAPAPTRAEAAKADAAAEGAAKDAGAGPSSAPAAAAANPTETPAAGAAGDQPAQPPQPASAAAAAPAAAAPGAVPGSPAAPRDPSLVDVARAVRPGGLLEPTEQVRIMRAVAAVLRRLFALPRLAEPLKAPPGTPREDAALILPQASSSCLAALQLASSLSLSHSSAAVLLEEGLLRPLLNPPVHCRYGGMEEAVGAIVRLLLEDPVTLQGAMEAEMRAALFVEGSAAPPTSAVALRRRSSGSYVLMRMADFLQRMRRWAVRDPEVFLKAFKATCTVEVYLPPHLPPGRASNVVRLIEAPGPEEDNPAAAPAAAAPRPAAAPAVGAAAGPSGATAACGEEATRAAGGAPASTSAPAPAMGSSPPGGKGGAGVARHKRPKAPASFVDVISALLEVVSGYKGPDAAVESVRPLPSESFSEAPAAGWTPADAHNESVTKTLKGYDDRVQAEIAAAMSATAALKHLAYAVVYYQQAGAVVLKRDLEDKAQQIKGCGPILKRVVRSFLPATASVPVIESDAEFLRLRALTSPTPPETIQYRALVCQEALSLRLKGLGEATKEVLTGLCVKSPDARKRVITEVLDALQGTPAPPPQGPRRVRAYVDILGGLAQPVLPPATAPGSLGSRPQPQPRASPLLAAELIRTMRELGAVPTLTRLLSVLDLDHAEGWAAAQATIRPLEALTRAAPPLPHALTGPQTGKPAATGGQGSGAAAAGAAGAAAAGAGPAAGAEPGAPGAAPGGAAPAAGAPGAGAAVEQQGEGHGHGNGADYDMEVHLPEGADAQDVLRAIMDMAGEGGMMHDDEGGSGESGSEGESDDDSEDDGEDGEDDEDDDDDAVHEHDEDVDVISDEEGSLHGEDDPMGLGSDSEGSEGEGDPMGEHEESGSEGDSEGEGDEMEEGEEDDEEDGGEGFAGGANMVPGGGAMNIGNFMMADDGEQGGESDEEEEEEEEEEEFEEDDRAALAGHVMNAAIGLDEDDEDRDAEDEEMDLVEEPGDDEGGIGIRGGRRRGAFAAALDQILAGAGGRGIGMPGGSRELVRLFAQELQQGGGRLTVRRGPDGEAAAEFEVPGGVGWARALNPRRGADGDFDDDGQAVEDFLDGLADDEARERRPAARRNNGTFGGNLLAEDAARVADLQPALTDAGPAAGDRQLAVLMAHDGGAGGVGPGGATGGLALGGGVRTHRLVARPTAAAPPTAAPGMFGAAPATERNPESLREMLAEAASGGASQATRRSTEAAAARDRFTGRVGNRILIGDQTGRAQAMVGFGGARVAPGAAGAGEDEAREITLSAVDRALEVQMLGAAGIEAPARPQPGAAAAAARPPVVPGVPGGGFGRFLRDVMQQAVQEAGAGAAAAPPRAEGAGAAAQPAAAAGAAAAAPRPAADAVAGAAPIAGTAPAGGAPAAAAAGGDGDERMAVDGERPEGAEPEGGAGPAGGEAAAAVAGEPDGEEEEEDGEGEGEDGAGMFDMDGVEEIDPAFLDALPADLRAEVLAQHRAQVEHMERNRRRRAARAQQAPAAAPPQPAAAAAEGAPAAPAGTAAAQPAAQEGAAPAQEPPQPAAAAAPAQQQPQPAAQQPAAGGNGGGELGELGIDPEYFAALPADIQEELLAEQRIEARRRRDLERMQAQARAAPGGNAELVALLANFPPDVREEVLLTWDEATIDTLPPALAEEARGLRRAAGIHAEAQAAVQAANAAAPAAPAVRPAAVARPQFQPPPPSNILASPDDPLAALGLAVVGGGGRTPGVRPQGVRRMMVPSGRGPAWAYEREQAANLAGGAGPSTAGRPAARPEGEPPMDPSSLRAVFLFLRHPQPLAKSLLQRLFLNLCAQSSTRQRVLSMLLSVLREELRASLEEEDGTGDTTAEAGGSSGAPGGPGNRRSLGDALAAAEVTDVPPRTSEGMDAGALSLAAQAANLPTDAVGSSSSRVPPLVTRRVLELLVHLSRYDNWVAEELVSIRVPTAVEVGLAADPKGKAPAVAEGSGPQAIEVLLGMLRSRQVRGSAPQLEQCLALVHAAAQAASRADPSGESPQGGLSVLRSLPEGLVAPLADLVAHPGLSNQALGRLCHVLKALADLVPALQPALVRQVAARVTRCQPEALAGLSDVVQTLQRSESAAPLTGAVGKPLLQALKALNILSKSGAFSGAKATPEEEDKPKEGGEEEAGGSGAAAPSSNAGGSAPAKPAAAAAADDASSGVKATVTKEVESLVPHTEHLWASLSACLDQVEAEMGHVDAPGASRPVLEASAASKLLPRGAAQVLPVVESLFVFADTLHQGLGRAKPFSIHRVGFTGDKGLDADALPSVPTSPTTSGHGQAGALAGRTSAGVSGPPSPTWPHPPSVVSFTERHRRLINAFVRQDYHLLEKTMHALLAEPRLIDFDSKRAYFRHKVRRALPPSYNQLRLAVRRDHVFEDSFQKLRMYTPQEWRGKLQVAFLGEEGIDAGGVTREWYSVMAREIFNPGFSLFVNVPEGGTTFQPNPNSMVQDDPARGTNHLDYFKFVGRVVGKSLYDGQLMDAYFTRSFYKHMLGMQITFEDVEAVDPDYHRTLKWMLANEITDVLDLTFTAEVDYFGRKELIELVPGGSKVKVTEENKREYVRLMARHTMTTAIRDQINAFLQGFWEMVPRELVSIFDDHELELLISGLPEIDIADLKANTEYHGYTAATPVIRYFWEAVAELDKEDKARLLQFVTGTSKVPLEGFRALQGVSGPQRFQIHKAYGPTDRLPQAHTCFNQLDLVEYGSKEQLTERLLVAIRAGSGFGFA